ncbi:MAG: spore maturation protein [Bacillales bacterium]|jgi:spore maturation protein A|nr:spore maturation protein [Bacillales bacterium]
MVNYIWGGMIIISVICGILNGTIEEVNKAAFEGAKEAVTISIGLISVLMLWMGLMEIAQKAGIIESLSKFFQPAVGFIFPEVPKNHPAMGYMVSNMIANMFGLGNAATPLGLKAMDELQSLNKNKEEASRSMITFLAINTSSVTLVPTTVISLRMTYGSTSPTDIVLTTILASLVATIGAIIIDWLFYKKRSRRERR